MKHELLSKFKIWALGKNETSFPSATAEVRASSFMIRAETRKFFIQLRVGKQEGSHQECFVRWHRISQ